MKKNFLFNPLDQLAGGGTGDLSYKEFIGAL